MLVPAEMTVALNVAHQHRVGVLNLRQPIRVGPRRRLVDRVRRLHPQRLMRADFVVIVAKAIQFQLLAAPVLGRPQVQLQRAMHALVAPVLLRMTGLNALRHDAQLHPPRRQPRQPAHGRAGKRRPVVGAYPPGQPKLAERCLEDGPHPFGVGLGQSLRTQQAQAT